MRFASRFITYIFLLILLGCKGVSSDDSQINIYDVCEVQNRDYLFIADIVSTHSYSAFCKDIPVSYCYYNPSHGGSGECNNNVYERSCRKDKVSLSPTKFISTRADEIFGTDYYSLLPLGQEYVVDYYHSTHTKNPLPWTDRAVVSLTCNRDGEGKIIFEPIFRGNDGFDYIVGIIFSGQYPRFFDNSSNYYDVDKKFDLSEISTNDLPSRVYGWRIYEYELGSIDERGQYTVKKAAKLQDFEDSLVD